MTAYYDTVIAYYDKVVAYVDPIIGYLPTWLQPLAIWGYLYDFLSILVPLLDIALALYLAVQTFFFLRDVHFIAGDDSACGVRSTEENFGLRQISREFGIADSIVYCSDKLKEEKKGKLPTREELASAAVNDLRWLDFKSFCVSGTALIAVGIWFTSYFSVATILVQCVIFSMIYPYLVHLVFKHRKKIGAEKDSLRDKGGK